MGMYAGNQAASPVFDGSDTSLGGDGKFVEHSSYLAPIPGLVANVSIPKFPGTGGGCVTSGPFKDLQLSLGPVSVPDSMKKDPKDVYGLKANPRCLSRDFFQPTSNANLTWTQITKLVQQPDIAGFRNYLEATMHPNGHIFIGAEGADPFSTTNDPAFYLLHAQIDRMWAIWQGQDIKNRLNALDGTTTFFGIPLLIAPTEPTRNATLDDVMDLGLKGKFTLRQGMSTTSDGRCFIYE
jgi:tyrosinase